MDRQFLDNPLGKIGHPRLLKKGPNPTYFGPRAGKTEGRFNGILIKNLLKIFSPQEGPDFFPKSLDSKTKNPKDRKGFEHGFLSLLNTLANHPQG